MPSQCRRSGHDWRHGVFVVRAVTAPALRAGLARVGRAAHPAVGAAGSGADEGAVVKFGAGTGLGAEVLL